MHHGIMIKVNGDSQAKAQVQAEDIMAKTIRCEKCEASVQDINWDYFGFYGVVDSDWIKKHRAELKIETVEELVQHYIDLRKSSVEYAEKCISSELKKFNTEYKKTKKFPRYTMLDYYIRKLESIRNVIEFGDSDDGLYTLHCSDNHYADMTGYTKGKKAFYFWYDRHY